MVLKLLVAQIRQYSSSTTKTMKYLNVAEKNDAAKTIANFLSNGTSQRVRIIMQIFLDFTEIITQS